MIALPHSLAQYLLESSLCLALFFALYQLLLKRETFFQLNRLYLLLAPLIAFLIPLIQVGGSSVAFLQAEPVVRQAQQVRVELYTQIHTPSPQLSLSVADVLSWIYGLGAAWMLLVLLRRLWALFRIIKSSKRQRSGRVTLLQAQGEVPASSFFSYIFWNGQALREEERVVLEHELVHVRQWHSLDVLLMECYVVLKWFNPLIYAYRQALRQVHEYAADAYVSRKMGSRLQYANLLASQHLNAQQLPLAHTFAAYLRKRLWMLAQPDSKTWNKLKYLCMLPLTVILMLLFSFDLEERLLGGGVSQAGQYLDQLSQEEIYANWGDAPTAEASQLQWGLHRLPLVHESALQGEASLRLTRMSPAAFEALKAERMELVADGQVLWRRSASVRMLSANGSLSDFEMPNPLSVYGDGFPKEDFSLLLQFEDVWGRKSFGWVWVTASTGDYDWLQAEPLLRQLSKTLELTKPNGKQHCINLDKPYHEIDYSHTWEYSPFKLQVGKEQLSLQWYNNPFVEDFQMPTYQYESDQWDAIKNSGIVWERLPEFYQYYDKPVQLQWRGVKAGLEPKTAVLSAFKQSEEKTMQLTVGGRAYPIRQLELILRPEQGLARSYVLPAVGGEIVSQLIRTVQPNTALLVKNIVLRDTDGRDKHFPPYFTITLN